MGSLRFCEALLAMANQLGIYIDTEVFIMGDFNVDLLGPYRSNTKRDEARMLKNTILQIGCIQYINEITHFDPNGKHLHD